MIVIPLIGESGSGKTASARNLDPNKTLWISVLGKRPPFANFKNYKIKKEGVTHKEANFYVEKDPTNIIKIVTAKIQQGYTSIFIDDANYLAAISFLNKATQTGFTKFNVGAQEIYNFIAGLKSIETSAICFMTWHISISETIDVMADSVSKINMKVPSKLIREHIDLDGLFEIILYSYKTVNKETNKIEGKFKTIDTITTAKSPMGLFEEPIIDNDLEEVRKKLVDFYGENL